MTMPTGVLATATAALLLAAVSCSEPQTGSYVAGFPLRGFPYGGGFFPAAGYGYRGHHGYFPQGYVGGAAVTFPLAQRGPCQFSPFFSSAKAVCVMTGETVEGTVNFEQKGYEVQLTGEIRGLTSGKHGFHVHEYGSIADDCGSAGDHFNLYNNQHGGPSSLNRHTGDLGNIEADDDGVATVDIKDARIQLCGAQSIVGRALVVHADEDDLGTVNSAASRKTGNAGDRLGCCVIGITQ